jgi:hypothetical protein
MQVDAVDLDHMHNAIPFPASFPFAGTTAAPVS